jgi:WD40 repeat protein
MVSDGSSGKQLRTLGQRVTRLAWAPDGGRIAAGDGRTVSIHAKNGTDASKPRPIAGDLLLGWRTDPDRVVAVDSDRIEVWKLDGSKPESAIVNGLGSPAPAVWDPVRFTRIARLEGHAADVSVARWSPDGKMLATADSAGTVRTWDAKAGTAVDSFTAYKGAIALLEWSPDGKAIAVAGAAGPVNVFSPTGEKVAEFAGHARGVSSLAWGPTPEHLVTGGRDERTVRWDVPGGTEPKAIGYAAGGLAIVNPTTGAVVKDVQGRGGSDSVYGVAWLEGKEPRLISGQGSSVAVVDGVTGVRMPRQVVLNPARSLVLPKNVVVTAGNDRSVRFWNLADAKAVWTIVDDGSALAVISANGSVAFDPDTEPDLMAVVEREDGSVWMPLAEFAKSCGWKNAPKSIKLPTKQ